MNDTVLLLRACRPGGESRNGFIWPLEIGAEAVAPDWSPRAECGGGLHGLLWGEGDGALLDWSGDAVWMVVEATAVSVVDLGGKVKVPRATVRHVGDRVSATAWLAERAPGRKIVGGTATAGHRGTATAGHRGTATAGDGGTATAGDGGTATAGHRGTATAGHGGTATAGHRGTATAGYGGTATAGDEGTATAGHGGTATAGHRGTATAGHRGTATAGDGGTLTLFVWNGGRCRPRVACVGEHATGLPDGVVIEPNVAYRCEWRDGGAHWSRAGEGA